MRQSFPFAAIVGQEEMKQALLVAAVDPAVGGVLAFGDRGTGKSTAVRALAGLLPRMQVVEGCRFACDPKAPACDECRDAGRTGVRSAPVPVVELPLGATEDRVVGALDLERALVRGEKAFEPGLLARAHRGFLYIDEVNLLEDHLVDLLIDVAASGENIVEREGLSVRHPARFVLVGSGNPEEGELRPQLLDRFGLSVDVRTPEDIATRIVIVRRRDAFDRDPAGFAAEWAEAEAEVRAADRGRAPAPAAAPSVRRGAGGRGQALPPPRHGRAARRADPDARRPGARGVCRRGPGRAGACGADGALGAAAPAAARSARRRGLHHAGEPGGGGAVRDMSAAALLAVDPAGLGGAVLLGPPGPARDRWLAGFRAALPAGVPFRRVPLGIGEDRLLGGLDLVATLGAGRPLAQRGVLAEADGGVVLLASAERLETGVAARIAAVLDRAEVAAERDGMALRNPARIGVIALDERAEAEPGMPPALEDRLAFWLDPREPGPNRDGDAAAARALLAQVEAGTEVVESLCVTAAALGIASLRAPILALRAARAAAALAGRTEVTAEDAALAAQLVLAPRATAAPAQPEPTPPPQDDQTPDDRTPEPDGAMSDIVLQAVLAALPPGLLARLAAGRERKAAAGRSGPRSRTGARGRPAGSSPGDPRAGLRLALLDTLRAAVPFQRLRGGGERIQVRASDLRVIRRKPRTETTTIFLVDASGSQAAARLAEAKGAVQLLLSDCYVRRDQVALIGFRGRTAELLLAPTRSLVRAKRSLAGLPGGGGTPLAAGLELGCALADSIRRRGGTPALVLLTDGQANVGRDGRGGRTEAERDAHAAARRLRAACHPAILVDSALRPLPAARRLAAEMGARYVALPFAGAAAISGLVRAAP